MPNERTRSYPTPFSNITLIENVVRQKWGGTNFLKIPAVTFILPAFLQNLVSQRAATDLMSSNWPLEVTVDNLELPVPFTKCLENRAWKVEVASDSWSYPDDSAAYVAKKLTEQAKAIKIYLTESDKTNIRDSVNRIRNYLPHQQNQGQMLSDYEARISLKPILGEALVKVDTDKKPIDPLLNTWVEWLSNEITNFNKDDFSKTITGLDNLSTKLDKALVECAKKVAEKPDTSIRFGLGIFVKNMVGVGSPPQYKFQTHGYENNTLDYNGFLEKLEGMGQTRGLVVIPMYLGEAARGVVTAWLNTARHHNLVIADLLPQWKNLDDIKKNLIGTDFNLRIPGRAGRRFATAAPYLVVQSHEQDVFVSPAFALAALMARTPLGSNFVGSQGSANDINGLVKTVGQYKLSHNTSAIQSLPKDIQEALIEQGVNPILLDTYASGYPFILERGESLTKTNVKSEAFLAFELMRAAIEELFISYIRTKVFGGNADKHNVQREFNDLCNSINSQFDENSLKIAVQVSFNDNNRAKIQVEMRHPGYITDTDIHIAWVDR